MDKKRLWTAAEVELLTPDERQRLLNERVVTDLAELPADFVARVRLQGQAIVDAHRADKTTSS